MNDIIFGGQSLNRHGFAVRHFPVHTVGQRDMEFRQLYGRSGDLIRSNRRFSNVEMTYEINTFDLKYLQNKALLERDLIDLLLSADGYQRFEDSTVPDYFTNAVCTSVGEIFTNHLNGYLSTTITFSRVPFWYAKTGQEPVSYSLFDNNYILQNPEKYEALPLIRIKTDAAHTTLVVNNAEYDIYFPESGMAIELDAETMQASNGSTDMNAYITGDYFPTLRSGMNTIRLWKRSSAAVELEEFTIIPRWRRL